jgi:hypothetical protein
MSANDPKWTSASCVPTPFQGSNFRRYYPLSLGAAMRRREFILGGVASAWSVTARAQQGERMRRVGVILPATPDDAASQTWMGVFLQAQGQLG